MLVWAERAPELDLQPRERGFEIHLEVCSYRFDSGSEDCITVFSTSCREPS